MSISPSLRSRLVQIPSPAAPPLGGSGPSVHNIGVVREQQIGDNWCWAAVSVAIRNFQQPGSPLAQCQLVMIQLGHNDCCTVPVPQPCDQKSRLEVALANAGVAADNHSGIMSFSVLTQRLLGNRPICCAIRWSSGDFHFVQVDGFIQGGPRGDEVFVNDPNNPVNRMTYDALVANYLDVGGTWQWTYRVL